MLHSFLSLIAHSYRPGTTKIHADSRRFGECSALRDKRPGSFKEETRRPKGQQMGGGRTERMVSSERGGGLRGDYRRNHRNKLLPGTERAKLALVNRHIKGSSCYFMFTHTCQGGLWRQLFRLKNWDKWQIAGQLKAPSFLMSRSYCRQSKQIQRTQGSKQAEWAAKWSSHTLPVS